MLLAIISANWIHAEERQEDENCSDQGSNSKAIKKLRKIVPNHCKASVLWRSFSNGDRVVEEWWLTESVTFILIFKVSDEFLIIF